MRYTAWAGLPLLITRSSLVSSAASIILKYRRSSPPAASAGKMLRGSDICSRSPRLKGASPGRT